MPECCCGCPCCYEKADGSCFCTAVKDGEPCDIEGLDQRLPNCPAEDIPEPHGRLIDADRLEDRIKNTVGKYDTAIPLNVVYRLIADAHPIIEAEG